MGKTTDDQKPTDSKFDYVTRLSKSIASRSGDFTRVLDFFEKHSKNLSFVQCVSQKTNLSPGVVLLVLCCLVLVFFVSKLGGSLICDAVGFLYPSYKSYKVLKTTEKLTNSKDHPNSESNDSNDNSESNNNTNTNNDNNGYTNNTNNNNPNNRNTNQRNGDVNSNTNSQDENKKQLVYWTKYWVVFSLGFIFNYFANIFLYWLPFYYLAKLLFIVLLLHPKLQGAELIYNYVIAPLLNKYETTIDNAVGSLETTADQLIIKYGVEKISGRLKDYATKQTAN